MTIDPDLWEADFKQVIAACPAIEDKVAVQKMLTEAFNCDWSYVYCLYLGLPEPVQLLFPDRLISHLDDLSNV